MGGKGILRFSGREDVLFYLIISAYTSVGVSRPTLGPQSPTYSNITLLVEYAAFLNFLIFVRRLYLSFVQCSQQVVCYLYLTEVYVSVFLFM